VGKRYSFSGNFTPFFDEVARKSSHRGENSSMKVNKLIIPAKGLKIASLSPIRVLLSSFAGSYALVMEAFPVFGQVERKHARKDEQIVLARSNIDAIGIRQAEPTL
jgi:hypothetical protein